MRITLHFFCLFGGEFLHRSQTGNVHYALSVNESEGFWLEQLWLMGWVLVCDRGGGNVGGRV